MTLSFPVRMLLILSLMAVGLGQVFGLKQAYMAEIEGQWVQTKASHHHACDTLQAGHIVCYKPHVHLDEVNLAADHAEVNLEDHCDANHSICGDSPVKEHTPLETTLELVKSQTPSLNFNSPLVAVLKPWQMAEILGIQLPLEMAKLMNHGWRSEEAFAPPKAVEIARCMVLLI